VKEGADSIGVVAIGKGNALLTLLQTVADMLDD